MDILSARKKAAELTRTQKQAESETTVPSQPDTVEAPSRRKEVLLATPAMPGDMRPSKVEEPATEVPGTTSISSSEGVAGETHAQEIEMLSFRLGGEEYVLPVDDVREVLKSRELTVVPNSPSHILGVTSIRGTVLPVIDLGSRLGLPPAVRDEKARIIIISPDDEDAGIVVDRVTGVVRIAPDAIRPAPETIEQGAEYLKGIARKDDRLYILLDLNKAAGN
jgi:purine-binding chemotaxis protein CheW